MTGTKVSFSTTKRAERIRKTIVFDPANDAFALNYINCRVEDGESFSSVVKELVLQMITLIELAPTHLAHCQNTLQTDCQNTLQTENPAQNTGKVESPFDTLLT